jgi:acetoin utilization deacetylase AcuC-like enzyme
MPLLYTHPLFLEHDTGDHPEHAGRLTAISERFEQTGEADACPRPKWEPVSLERLARVHSLEYAEAVQLFAAGGGRRIESDTVVSPASFDVALFAAGAACDAVERVVRGEAEPKRALCLVRPPGHHALHDNPMGFCLFNNVAVAARTATAELGIDRVLIIDWDVHHGNGTQDTFWEDPQVAFFSIHRFPFYPGTGRREETGGGAGAGCTLNVPVAFGTPRRDYLSQFQTELTAFADRVRPQLVLLSAGFDAHRADPVGSLGLEIEDFGTLTNLVCDLADQHAGGRLVSLLEGGYNPPVLAECVELHLKEMRKRESP